MFEGCAHVQAAFLCGSIELGAIFYSHLVFLAEKMSHKQMQNLRNV